ncbi:unnamed protein product [Cercospora beticola]|nr:unnamed protein product [Cercospora beticola]
MKQSKFKWGPHPARICEPDLSHRNRRLMTQDDGLLSLQTATIADGCEPPCCDVILFEAYMVEVKLRGGTESAQAAWLAVADLLAFYSASSSSSVLLSASTANLHEISKSSAYDRGLDRQRAREQLPPVTRPDCLRLLLT